MSEYVQVIKSDATESIYDFLIVYGYKSIMVAILQNQPYDTHVLHLLTQSILEIQFFESYSCLHL